MTVPTRIVLLPLRNRTGSVVAHAIVDAVMEPLVAQWRWSLNANGYVWRSIRGGRAHVYLHRQLAGAAAGDGLYVDHINRDRLDCRRANLRLVTPQQSAQNKPALTGRFRGVSWDASRRRWMASAQLDRKRHFIGRFATEEEAAAAAEAWRRERMPYSAEAVS